MKKTTNQLSLALLMILAVACDKKDEKVQEETKKETTKTDVEKKAESQEPTAPKA